MTTRLQLHDKELKSWVMDYCKVTKRTESSIVREALESFRDVQAWQHKAIQEGIDYADSPDAKFADHEEVMEWVKSWGTDNPKDLPECK